MDIAFERCGPIAIERQQPFHFYPGIVADVAFSEIPGPCPVGQVGYFIEHVAHMLVHLIPFQLAGRRMSWLKNGNSKEGLLRPVAGPRCRYGASDGAACRARAALRFLAAWSRSARKVRHSLKKVIAFGSQMPCHSVRAATTLAPISRRALPFQRTRSTPQLCPRRFGRRKIGAQLPKPCDRRLPLSRERVVERHQVAPALGRKVSDFVEVDARLLTAPLGRHPGPRVVEQNIAHDSRRNSEELRPMPQIDFGHIGQAQVRFVNQTRSLNGARGTFILHVMSREAAQLVVNAWRELVERGSIAA